MKKKKRSLGEYIEILDNVISDAEVPISNIGLGATGATFCFPNPYTAGIAVGANILGGGIDLYQAGRAIYNKDYATALLNGGEALLSFSGAKAIKKGVGAYSLAKDYAESFGKHQTRHTLKEAISNVKYLNGLGKKYLNRGFSLQAVPAVTATMNNQLNNIVDGRNLYFGKVLPEVQITR